MAGANVQILVVDDEAEVRALLRKCFEREGFHRAYSWRNGAYVDSISMARLRL